VLLTAFASAKAQNIGEQLKQNTSFGGYVISRANATTQDDAKVKADFQIRLVRLYVDTRLGDFQMKFQAQMNGNTSGVNGPRIVDAWAEWQHWKEFRVKAGQFKRPFTFENPMHPWLIGNGTYTQLSTKLAGFSDRTGEHSSNGRDVGVQVQGDLFASPHDGHRWFHYQAGVFTGQGINFSDRNTRKDLIGGVWIAPIEQLQIGAFGWTGNFVTNDGVTLERRRYNFGVKYTGDWMARAEFAVDNANGGADAWYALVGTPTWHRSRLFLHYDVYREGKTFDNGKSIYGITAQHSIYTNLMLQANYGYNVNKTAADQHYHTIDLQLYWRF